MAETSESTGMGIVIGILLAVLLGVGAYYFMGPGNAASQADISISTPNGNFSADVK